MNTYVGKKLVIIKSLGADMIFSSHVSEITKFVLDIAYANFNFTMISGHDPLVEEFYAGLFKVIGEDIDVYQRKSNFRFCHRTGMSGASDMFIECLEHDGFPKRRFIMHISMMNKISMVPEGSFLYDVLDLGRALGYVTVEDGKYRPSEKLNDKIKEEAMQFKLVEPRIIDEEDGWGEYELVSINNIVRKDEADEFKAAQAEAFAEEDDDQ